MTDELGDSPQKTETNQRAEKAIGNIVKPDVDDMPDNSISQLEAGIDFNKGIEGGSMHDRLVELRHYLAESNHAVQNLIIVTMTEAMNSDDQETIAKLDELQGKLDTIFPLEKTSPSMLPYAIKQAMSELDDVYNATHHIATNEITYAATFQTPFKIPGIMEQYVENSTAAIDNAEEIISFMEDTGTELMAQDTHTLNMDIKPV